MENHVTAGATLPSTGEWPAVPPAPAPVKPATPATPEPALVTTMPGQARPASAMIDGRLDAGSDLADSEPVTAVPGPAGAMAVGTANVALGQDDAAAVARAGRAPTAAGRAARLTPRTIPRPRTRTVAGESVLQRAIRRPGPAGQRGRDLVWQPGFAYTAAAIIILALTVVTLPLWIVLYQLVGTAGTDTGAHVSDLIALCMMLSGGYLTGAALWVVIVEMRGRVRLVDTLARTGEREVLALADTPPLEEEARASREPLRWDPARIPPHIVARVEAQQASAAQTLDASSKLLNSFSAVLKSYGQLPAQVMLLAVALALFVSATVLSLN